MNNRILQQVSGIVLIGAAAFSLSACTPMADSSPGYYSGPAQNSDIIFQNTNPEEVRYAITRDMYNQGYYLAYDGNPLVFERPMAGYRDMERVTFWLEVGYDGTRVIVDQAYLVYSGGGWRESRDWNDPGHPIFMFQYMFDFHDRYYRHPHDYWQRERERDRDRDWSRQDVRERWEHEVHENNRRPALPPVSTEPPRPQGMREFPRGQQADPAQRQQQMRDMQQRWQQQHPTLQQQGQPSQQPQGQQPKTQQMRDMQERWQQQRQQHQQPSQEQPQAIPQQPQLQQYRQQMERRQQEQLQQQEQLRQQDQMQRQQQMQQQEQIRQQQMQRMQQMQQMQQMREDQRRPQPQPEMPQSQPQKQKQQSQPDQSQPQPSVPSQKQLDEIRERLKGQQPH